jgi:hypothetical protein
MAVVIKMAVQRDWRTDYTAYVPAHEYKNLSKEEKDRRREAIELSRQATRAINAAAVTQGPSAQVPSSIQIPQDAGTVDSWRC